MTYRILLQGGLGNQLFQVAAGTYLQEKTGRKVKFDTTLLTRLPRNIRLRDVEVEWLVEDSDLKRGSLLTLGSIFLDRYIKNIVLKEQDLNDKILNLVTARPTIISGYFHIHEYVSDTWHILGSKIISKLEQSFNQSSVPKNYIAVHFRGGDYLNNPKTKKIFGVTGLGYFKEAINRLVSELNIDNVIFVTDTPDFIKENLFEFKSFHTVISSSKNIYEDLALISHSSGVVMSNSSFSWWGAFVAHKTSNAKIIAPKPWFTAEIDEPLHLLPSNWTVLERDIFH